MGPQSAKDEKILAKSPIRATHTERAEPPHRPQAPPTLKPTIIPPLRGISTTRKKIHPPPPPPTHLPSSPSTTIESITQDGGLRRSRYPPNAQVHPKPSACPQADGRVSFTLAVECGPLGRLFLHSLLDGSREGQLSFRCVGCDTWKERKRRPQSMTVLVSGP